MARAAPYTVFDAVLQRKQELSPHLMRVTLAGPMVAGMATWAPDQRVKLFFPAADGSLARLAHDADWHTGYRSLPLAQRPAMRTYTIRHLRPAQGEVDIDFVLHGETGPASRWALHAQPGANLQIVAPDRRFSAEQTGGFEWKPPMELGQLLLMADATALPAALGILEELAGQHAPPATQAFFEVQTVADRLPVPQWPGLEVQWLIRDERASVAAGMLMVEAVQSAQLPDFNSAVGDPGALPDIDIDQEILWETGSAQGAVFYAWIAGESAAVMSVRKYLVGERQIPRQMLNLMGYWRYNKAGS